MTLMSLRQKKERILVGVVFLTAFLLRLLLIPNFGFEADISFWKSWGLAVYDRGIVWAAHNTNNNYPTPFAYLLGVMVYIYSLFANPHNFNQFWNNANLLFLTISKFPAILADFGIAGIIYWIGKNTKRISFPELPFNFYLLLLAAYLLNPIALVDGAWWGQVDSVGVFIFLLALVMAATKRPFWAGLIFVTSMMTKLQNMIYGPIFFLFLWQYLGYEGLLKGLAGATLAFFGLNLEFLLARDMGRVVGSLTDNFDYFPLMSLNAYNLWWLVAGGQGMQVSDKLLALGITNAKSVGLILFSSFYLLAVLFFPLVKEQPLKKFLVSLVIVSGSFFLFQTQSHDRYAFPLSVFLLLLVPFWAKATRKIYLAFYVFFSLVYFYNLHTAMVVNYPHNGLPWLSLATGVPLTVGASLVLLGLFAAFIFAAMKEARPLVYVAPLILALLTLAAVNLPLLLKKSISLTRLVPFVSQQDFGSRMTNMPVDASFGFSKWGPLSVEYFFYRKGIGTHANSFMNFDLAGQFKRFTTDYGIDTEAGTQGLAIFEIYADGKKLFSSDPIGRFDIPRHIEVDITNVKTLGLVTKAAGEGITDDHTDWLNPVLWP